MLLFLIDIDFFKKINDTYGHQAGDKVLRDIASLIQKKLPSSIVLTRIGGEEFAFLSTAFTVDEGKVLAEEIRVAVEREKFVYLNDTINVSVSIGITFYKQDDNFFKEIFSRADNALYKAKNNGRNQVQIK